MLAFVSWIFGIMMAVAGDLPQLESRAQFENAENSVVYDINGEKIATLTNNQGRILVESADIAPVMKEATVAIEDQRFYEHRGIDYEGIGRAVFQDILAFGATQGGSTITQQFVKNALRAQRSRTVFEKLREAALAYQLERNWDKDKILTEYLNVIYFGQGAYGIEAAAKTYFGWNHPGCGPAGNRCASELLPWEAAMLAGMISNPSGFDPKIAPEAATARRNLVLQNMADQGYLTQEEADQYSREQPPAASQIRTPEEDSLAPYFTSWLRPQLVDKYGAGEAFGGGLDVISTLDLSLQEEAQQIAYSRTAGVGLSSAVVVLDNETGGVRAMVGGYDYREQPFNLATQGQRQPGSAFKPFTLVTALEQGISPDSVYSSQPKALPFKVPGVKAPQLFEVNNYEDSYLGSASIATATTYSDNSVYAELGLQVGTENIAKTAHEMGIETPISTNPAMILGGLEQGVSPLDMAHAFQTLAHDGQRVSGTMATSDGAPIGIQKVSDEPPGVDGNLVETNDGEEGQDRVETEQVVSPDVAATRPVDPRDGGLPGNRHPCRDRRLHRVGQDRHDREQRRRLVRRRHPGRHDRRLGRPRQLREADGDRVRRRARGRRHDPRPDLPRRRARIRGAEPRQGRRRGIEHRDPHHPGSRARAHPGFSGTVRHPTGRPATTSSSSSSSLLHRRPAAAASRAARAALQPASR